MTSTQAHALLDSTPSDAALAVRDAKADLADGVDLTALPLDEIFGRAYAETYCRYIETARELRRMEAEA